MKRKLPLTIVVLLGAQSLAGTVPLLDDTLHLAVGHYRFVGFRVEPEQVIDAFVEGTVALDPDTGTIELILLHVDDFERWAGSGLDVDTLGYSRIGSGSFSMPIPGFGDYRLVVSNRGNYQSVRALCTASLSFSGSGVKTDPLIFAFHLALALIALAVVIILVVGVIKTWKDGRKSHRSRSTGKSI